MGLCKSKAQILFEEDMKRRETEKRKTFCEKETPLPEQAFSPIFLSIVESHGPGQPGGPWVPPEDINAKDLLIPYQEISHMLRLRKMSFKAREQYIKLHSPDNELDLAPVCPMSVLFLFAYLGHAAVVFSLLKEGYPTKVKMRAKKKPVYEYGSVACVTMISPLMDINQKLEIISELLRLNVDFSTCVPCAGNSVDGLLFTMRLTAYEIAVHRGLTQLWEQVEFATFGTKDLRVMSKRINMVDLAKSWCHCDGEDHLCRILFADMFFLFEDYCHFPGSVCRLIGEYYSTRARVIANVVKF